MKTLAPTLNLQSNIKLLPGVGPASIEKLNKKGFFLIKDLLFFLPIRYQDKTKLHDINQLNIGDYAQLVVDVSKTKINYGKKRSLNVYVLSDGCELILKFFHFSKVQLSTFTIGEKLLIYGQITSFNSYYSIIHPEYKVLKLNAAINLPKTLSPVYPVIKGIGVARIVGWIKLALDYLYNQNIDDLPDYILKKYRLAGLKESLFNLHYPSKDIDKKGFLEANNSYFKRIILDELLSKQIVILQKKQQIAKELAPECIISNKLQEKFVHNLPFTLTSAQVSVISDIFLDLSKNKPMHRLIQGDVGSGKTVVAFSACLQVIKQGMQVVLMAPTEVLAEQHYQNAKKLLSDFDTDITWVRGGMKKREYQDSLVKISSGLTNLVIGTHAVFQDLVNYSYLGLIVIDEQHRFGVEQRLKLRKKANLNGMSPHVLIMTATPIPRTLAMSFYADLDTSIINELPPNRKSIQTVVIDNTRRNELLERVHNLCKSGKQAYWVCALIEESEVLEAQAAEVIYEEILTKLVNVNIGLLHGRQSSNEKDTIMQRFKKNEIQLLISTTVIEVGVDVPNASLMVIENAERFGLSQLHQLRGRIGRGGEQSFCVLLFQTPLSETARKRLKIIKENNDGFIIAEEDLKIRGAGEVIGTKQTGEISFRIANLARDTDILDIANEIVWDLMKNNPKIVEEILSRWVGSDIDYLNA